MEITDEMKEMAKHEAQMLLQDKNRLSKAIAAVLRNEIENFHVAHLSDEQMKELNPLIRNAVFTFLTDYTEPLGRLEEEVYIENCFGYVEYATAGFFEEHNLDDTIFNDFLCLIFEGLTLALNSAAHDGFILLSHEIMFVPSYWEDCVYLPEVSEANI